MENNQYDHTPKEHNGMLLSAILDGNIMLAKELIKQGVSINHCDFCNDAPPLHIAIATNNLEAVCMLLFYGVDVNVTSNNATALDCTFIHGNYEILEVLNNYYDNEQFITSLLSYLTGRYLREMNEASLILNVQPVLIAIDSIINWTPVFRVLFELESFELFKIFWSRITDDILLTAKEPLLYTFFQRCNYTDTDFLECCYLILDSSNSLLISEQFNTSSCFLWHILAFIDSGKQDISRSHRLNLIYTLLSLGIQITPEDIVYVFNNNGYNKELLALIYCGNVNRNISDTQKYCMFPLTTFIFVLEENSSMKTIFKMFRNLTYRSYTLRSTQMERFQYYLRFFSLSTIVKEKLIRLCQVHIKCNEAIISKISKIRNIPSLLELGRNQTRHFIKKKYKVRKAYQFHAVVKAMNVPKNIKNIILYRTPIYD